MSITSREHLIAHAAALLQRAQQELQRDRVLVPVAIFETPESIRMCAYINVTDSALVRASIRQALQAKPNVEMVMFVSLGVALSDEEIERMRVNAEIQPRCLTVIGLEASHIDFGYVRLHSEYTRDDHGYHFKPICQSMAPGVVTSPAGSLLSELWPKRKLNS